MEYIDTIRIRVGKTISDNEYVKDGIFHSNNYILYLALDDALTYCVKNRVFFNGIVYFTHLQEYDLPLSFTADFIIDLLLDIQKLGDIDVTWTGE